MKEEKLENENDGEKRCTSKCCIPKDGKKPSKEVETSTGIGFKNEVIIAAIIGVFGIIAVTIGAMYGYALDYEPDFSVTLDAQNVQIDNCTGIDHNSIEIKDKCPHWCGLEDMLNMRYDNQIYYKIEGLPKGLICNFDPKAVNGIRDDPIIDINISATKCITSRVYSTKIVIYGADDKVKKCIMDIDVR